MQDTKLAQLSSLLTSLESRAQSSLAVSSSSLSNLHSAIASVERSLQEEISRRGEMERRIADGVQSQVRLTTDRLADAVESEMTRLYRKMDSEVSARLDAFARELAAALSNRLPKIEDSILTSQAELRRLDNRLSTVEVKVKAIEEKFIALSEDVRGAVEDGKDENTRKQGVLSKELELVKAGLEVAKGEMKKVREEGLERNKELRSLLEAEVDAREEGDKDLVEVVTQYAGVLKRLQG